jgi:hypothetical protein
MKPSVIKKPTYKVFAQDGEASAWITVEMTREEIMLQTYPVSTSCGNCGKASSVVIQKGIALDKVSCPWCEVARLQLTETKGKKGWGLK